MSEIAVRSEEACQSLKRMRECESREVLAGHVYSPLIVVLHDGVLAANWLNLLFVGSSLVLCGL